ncbi:MAG: tetratricopeptide repeat protein [Anaerolineales bacterium]|nr:tetratricopeptide repeat protein [Anaerolineales bacterium]
MNNQTKEFQSAVLAMKQGQPAEARAILKGLIAQNPRDVKAWFLFAHVAQKKEHAVQCLENVLKLDPQNKAARQKLDQLQGRLSSSPQQASQENPVAPIPNQLPEQKQLSSPGSGGSDPSNPAGRKNTTTEKREQKGSRTLIYIVGAAAFLLFCCIGAALAAASQGEMNFTSPGSTSQPTVSPQIIYNVIQTNLNAANTENINLYMSTIHSKSPVYNDTLSTLQEAFQLYDLRYTLVKADIIEQSQNEVRVSYVLLTQKLRGPDFRNNKVSGVMILRPDDGVWKIYNQTVDDVDYLD